jgi:hypothetical protein
MEVACLVAPAEDWVARTAELVRAEGERRHPGDAPTCASGLEGGLADAVGPGQDRVRSLLSPH